MTPQHALDGTSAGEFMLAHPATGVPHHADVLCNALPGLDQLPDCEQKLAVLFEGADLHCLR